jgi:hypothetical protein
MIITEGIILGTATLILLPWAQANCTSCIRLDDTEFYMMSDYIKMDCEGYEYRILQGAEQTIRRCRPVVVIEQKPHDAYSKQYGQFAAVTLLQEWGMVELDQVKDDWIMGWQ